MDNVLTFELHDFRLGQQNPTAPAACEGVLTPNTGANDYITIVGGSSFPPVAGGVQANPTGISVTDRFCDRTFPASVMNAIVRCKFMFSMYNNKYYIVLNLKLFVHL